MPTLVPVRIRGPTRIEGASVYGQPFCEERADHFGELKSEHQPTML